MQFFHQLPLLSSSDNSFSLRSQSDFSKPSVRTIDHSKKALISLVVKYGILLKMKLGKLIAQTSFHCLTNGYHYIVFVHFTEHISRLLVYLIVHCTLYWF